MDEGTRITQRKGQLTLLKNGQKWLFVIKRFKQYTEIKYIEVDFLTLNSEDDHGDDRLCFCVCVTDSSFSLRRISYSWS